MLSKEDMLNIYKKHFSSRSEHVSYDFIDDVIDEIYESAESDVFKYKSDRLFVEKNIIKHILSLEHIDIEPEYLSLYTRKMNSSTVKNSKPIIIFDELLQYTLMSFYLTVYSLIFDQSRDNFVRCFKNCIVFLDLQGNKHEIGTYNYDDIIQLIKLPKQGIDLAMDTFWVSWTFIFAHELYHAINTKDISFEQEELEADKYAYSVLIDMIRAQSEGKISGEIQVYYEYLYLAPMMLMEYFKLLDFYNDLFDRKTIYTEHPSPVLRQSNLFNMFDEYIPDSFNTEKGNDLYNIFLDQIDMLTEQMKIKKQKNKLDILSDI